MAEIFDPSTATPAVRHDNGATKPRATQSPLGLLLTAAHLFEQLDAPEAHRQARKLVGDKLAAVLLAIRLREIFFSGDVVTDASVDKIACRLKRMGVEFPEGECAD